MGPSKNSRVSKKFMNLSEQKIKNNFWEFRDPVTRKFMEPSSWRVKQISWFSLSECMGCKRQLGRTVVNPRTNNNFKCL